MDSLLCLLPNALGEGLCWLPTDIPGPGVPAGPTAVFSPSLLRSEKELWEEQGVFGSVLVI